MLSVKEILAGKEKKENSIKKEKKELKIIVEATNDNKLSNKDNQVSDIANTLVDRLSSPNSYRLFCKIAYKNSQATIDRCVGLTLESPSVQNKGGYFVTLIKEYGDL